LKTYVDGDIVASHRAGERLVIRWVVRERVVAVDHTVAPIRFSGLNDHHAPATLTFPSGEFSPLPLGMTGCSQNKSKSHDTTK
jgi:hypothetical protein